MTENQLCDEIASLTASTYHRGLTFALSGNLSVRLDHGWLMTPSGATRGDVDPAALSKLDNTGRHISGVPPTKATFLHQAMDQQRPGACASVLLHSTHSVAELASEHHAEFLANHGPFIAGKSLCEAVYATAAMEQTATLLLLLRGHATNTLTSAQVATVQARVDS
jgi:3-dehydro-4-phosphotetronate decarboxylase